MDYRKVIEHRFEFSAEEIAEIIATHIENRTDVRVRTDEITFRCAEAYGDTRFLGVSIVSKGD